MTVTRHVPHPCLTVGCQRAVRRGHLRCDQCLGELLHAFGPPRGVPRYKRLVAVAPR